MQGSIRSGLVLLAAVLGLGVGVILSGGHGISPRPVIQAIGQYPGRLSPPSKPVLLGAYGKLALSFEANRGQADPEVRFLARGNGYTLFLTATETVLSLREPAAPGSRNEKQTGKPTVLRMRLVGANPKAEVEGVDELAGKSNYFIGNDPSKWRTNVPNYAKVEHRQVYPGIDLVYSGEQHQVRFDLVVSPHANPRDVRMAFDGIRGLDLDDEGNLLLRASAGVVRVLRPVAYQEYGGERREVRVRYSLWKRREATFDVGTYDAGRRLVIDPTLAYSACFGGRGGWTFAHGVALDPSGNVYVTGATESYDFPGASPVQRTNAGSNRSGPSTAGAARGPADQRGVVARSRRETQGCFDVV